MRIDVRLLFAFAALCLPAAAGAQDTSHWGVMGALTPAQSWNAIPQLSEYLFEHQGSADIKSTDFAIGIVRGRELGGDWGVSFVRRSLDDGSRFQADTELCSSTLNASGGFNESCSTAISSLLFARGMTFSGVEIHKYVPFVTIKRRVQVGMNFAGGVGAFGGALERHEYSHDFVFTGSGFAYRDTETITSQPAREFASVSPFPTGKVEAALGVLAAPGFKIRASGGFSFPGYRAFTLSGLYFFGAR